MQREGEQKLPELIEYKCVLECKVEKLEQKVEKLEQKAEKLEQKVEKLQKVTSQPHTIIPHFPPDVPSTPTHPSPQIPPHKDEGKQTLLTG